MTLAYDFYFLPSWNRVKFPNRHLTRSRSLREFFIGNSVKIFLLRDYGQSQYFYVPITSNWAFSFSIFVSFNNVISLNMRVIFPVMKVSLKNLIDYYTSTSVIMVKLKRRTSRIPRHRTSSLGPIFFFGRWISFYNNSETYPVHTNLDHLERNKFRSLSSYSHPQSEHHKV